jgi:hypothetical protein
MMQPSKFQDCLHQIPTKVKVAFIASLIPLVIFILMSRPAAVIPAWVELGARNLTSDFNFQAKLQIFWFVDPKSKTSKILWPLIERARVKFPNRQWEVLRVSQRNDPKPPPGWAGFWRDRKREPPGKLHRLWEIDCWYLNWALAHTQARWIWRAVSDVVLNFDALDEFVNDLEKQRDPLLDFVQLAHCLRGKYPRWPQGKNGWILSRHAVEVLAPKCRPKSVPECQKTCAGVCG